MAQSKQNIQPIKYAIVNISTYSKTFQFNLNAIVCTMTFVELLSENSFFFDGLILKRSRFKTLHMNSITDVRWKRALYLSSE
jgi:hypothetical protein